MDEDSVKLDKPITYQLPGITEFFWVSNDNGRNWNRHNRVWKKVSYGLWKRRMWVTDAISLLSNARYITAEVFAEWAVIAFVIIIVILIAVGIARG